jgi:hypothetical protein
LTGAVAMVGGDGRGVCAGKADVALQVLGQWLIVWRADPA